jgi:hypothetical protein
LHTRLLAHTKRAGCPAADDPLLHSTLCLAAVRPCLSLNWYAVRAAGVYSLLVTQHGMFELGRGPGSGRACVHGGPTSPDRNIQSQLFPFPPQDSMRQDGRIIARMSTLGAVQAADAADVGSKQAPILTPPLVAF